jgi:hypothetical protein
MGETKWEIMRLIRGVAKREGSTYLLMELSSVGGEEEVAVDMS